MLVAAMDSYDSLRRNWRRTGWAGLGEGKGLGEKRREHGRKGRHRRAERQFPSPMLLVPVRSLSALSAMETYTSLALAPCSASADSRELMIINILVLYPTMPFVEFAHFEHVNICIHHNKLLD
jgi:hypothetical protein